MKRRIVLALLSLPLLAQAQDQTHVFAGGKVEVVLPSNFRVVSKEMDTLIAVFGPEEDHKLELTLHEELQSANAADAAEQFVRDQALRKGRRLQQVPGKSLFMEPGVAFTEGGKTYKSLHLQVGFGKLFVVVTLTGPQPTSEAMSQFLGSPINTMVKSLRRCEA